MIKAHVDESQTKWDIGIPELVFTYNCSFHETTGLTPFEVMFGRQPRIPIDLVYPNTLDITREKIRTPSTIKVNEIENHATLADDINANEIDVLEDIRPR